VVSAVQAASCVYDAPNELKPNRSYNFDFVLDVSESAAVVVFDPVRTAAGMAHPVDVVSRRADAPREGRFGW
jgi:hypothetical protein